MVDFTLHFRTAIGLDRLALALETDGDPSYKIQMAVEDRYRITLAV